MSVAVTNLLINYFELSELLRIDILSLIYNIIAIGFAMSRTHNKLVMTLNEAVVRRARLW